MQFLLADGKVLVTVHVECDTRVETRMFCQACRASSRGSTRTSKPLWLEGAEEAGSTGNWRSARASEGPTYVSNIRQKEESCSDMAFRDQSCHDQDEEGAWQWRSGCAWLEATPPCQSCRGQRQPLEIGLCRAGRDPSHCTQDFDCFVAKMSMVKQLQKAAYQLVVAL